MTRYGLSCQRHGCRSPGSRLIAHTRTCSLSKMIPWSTGLSSISVPIGAGDNVVPRHRPSLPPRRGQCCRYPLGSSCAVESASDPAVSTASQRAGRAGSCPPTQSVNLGPFDPQSVLDGSAPTVTCRVAFGLMSPGMPRAGGVAVRLRYHQRALLVTPGRTVRRSVRLVSYLKRSSEVIRGRLPSSLGRCYTAAIDGDAASGCSPVSTINLFLAQDPNSKINIHKASRRPR
jgi:hypothetical protein